MDSSLLTRKYPQITNQKDSNDNSLYVSFIVMIILFFNETSTVGLEVWLSIDHLPSMHGVLEIQIVSGEMAQWVRRLVVKAWGTEF